MIAEMKLGSEKVFSELAKFSMLNSSGYFASATDER